MNFTRYFHTLRHLRPVQVYGRLWFRLNPARPNVRPVLVARLFSGPRVLPVERPAVIDGDTFHFMNTAGQVLCAADWNDPGQEKLWLYNLHYFDDLNALRAVERVALHRTLIARWVTENPPGVGNGWEPYPTSLRIVNWVKWVLAGNALEPGWIHSLGIQARWLRRRIEWHLLGNHLFTNAKALVFAGLFFEGNEAAEWLAKGLKILGREVPEQVLADGGHFELSPMYHAIILEDLLDMVNAAGAWPGRVPESAVMQWRETASRMLNWLKGLSHPDNGIAFFNDAALEIAPDYGMLEMYAKRLEITPGVGRGNGPVTCFSDSGYVRLERGDAMALLDVAPVGPDYLPGHAHADTLSFELSLFGQRVVVNSGTSQYGVGPERLRQRGTAAHSTVQIDGADSSEVWGGFRVARRARPFGLEIVEEDDVLTVVCDHDGYLRLAGYPIHRRCWRLSHDSLQVTDTIKGSFRAAVARYHFHPMVTVSGEGDEGLLRLPDGQAVRWSAVGGVVRVLPSTWHPEFGRSIPNECLEVLFDGPSITIAFAWE